MNQPIAINKNQIVDFCIKHHIRKLSFFGSVLREDFRPESDVDVLLEFEAGIRVGLFELMAMQLEFSDIIGREADFRLPGDLSRYFRDSVIAEAEVQYAA